MRRSRQLEASIGRRFQSLIEKVLGPVQSRTCLELYGDLLEAIVEKTEPVSGRRRIFPFNQLRIELLAETSERKALLEEAFGDQREFRKDIVHRLSESGCEPPEVLEIEIRFTQSNPENSPFAVEFLKKERNLPQVQIAILRGTTKQPTALFRQADIRLGRCAEVVDAEGRLVQRNDVAFLDNGDPINSTVSRRHAHILFESGAARFVLVDDRSDRGTFIFRGNRPIKVPKGDLRGACLQAGDEIHLGRAALRFEISAD